MLTLFFNGGAFRIGIMLRCIDERGFIAIYARNIIGELLKIDQKNYCFLFSK